MKTIRTIFLLMIALCLFSCEKNDEQPEVLDQETNLDIMFGVNLVSDGNQYSTISYNDQNLETLLNMLVENKFKQISVRVIWKVMEQSQGVYNSSAINHLKRILAKAKEYNLDVMLDFHTLFSNSNINWQSPSWLADIAPAKNINGDNVLAGSLSHIFYTDAAREAYAEMMKHVVSQLNNYSSLKYISFINEPFLYWNSIDNNYYFDQTVQYLTSGLRSVTDRPLSIRFLTSWNPWADDQKKVIGTNIWRDLDYIAMNQYFVDDDTYEKDGTVFWPMVKRSIVDIHNAGKKLIVTECGYHDGTNAEYAERWESLFNNRFTNYKPDVVQIWNVQNDGNYFSNTTGSYNLLKEQNQFADYVSESIVKFLDE